MFIGRRPDGTIYGCWTTRQPDDEFHPGQEEVADDHPDLVEFIERPRQRPETLADLKAALIAKGTIEQEDIDAVKAGD
jgi:hypothetical protein